MSNAEVFENFNIQDRKKPLIIGAIINAAVGVFAVETRSYELLAIILIIAMPFIYYFLGLFSGFVEAKERELQNREVVGRELARLKKEVADGQQAVWKAERTLKQDSDHKGTISALHSKIKALEFENDELKGRADVSSSSQKKLEESVKALERENSTANIAAKEATQRYKELLKEAEQQVRQIKELEEDSRKLNAELDQSTKDHGEKQAQLVCLEGELLELRNKKTASDYNKDMTAKILSFEKYNPDHWQDIFETYQAIVFDDGDLATDQLKAEITSLVEEVKAIRDEQGRRKFEESEAWDSGKRFSEVLSENSGLNELQALQAERAKHRE